MKDQPLKTLTSLKFMTMAASATLISNPVYAQSQNVTPLLMRTGQLTVKGKVSDDKGPLLSKHTNSCARKIGALL
jgi:hypothetical protein